MIVLDSSSLILMAKIDKLEVLEELHKKVLIPKAVYNEVVAKGKEGQYGDAYVIEKLIGKFIQVRELTAQSSREAQQLKGAMGEGEAEAVVLAEQEKCALLSDDWLSKKAAERRGINCRTTLGVLYETLKNNVIKLDDYEQALKDFTRHAWVSPEIVAEFLQAGYRLRGGKR